MIAMLESASAWVGQIAGASLKAILVLMVAMVVCLAMKRASAAARHLVLSLSLASLLILPVLSFALPHWQVAILPSTLTVAARPGNAAADRVVTGQSASVALPATGRKPAPVEPVNETAGMMQANVEAGPTADAIDEVEEPAQAAAAVQAAKLDWMTLAVAIWIAGMILALARLLLGTARAWMMMRRASEIYDASWTTLAGEIASRLNVARRVRLLKAGAETMPVTCGILRPAVLLPADADDWLYERRQVVLLHEIVHVKRGDCFTQMLAQIACAIYWFNPLVWIAARWLRAERERACDDQVIGAGTRASDYADHLLDIARSFQSARHYSFAAVAIARRSQLEGRLLAILDPGLRRSGMGRVASVTVGLIIASLISPLAAVQLSTQAQSLGHSAAEPALAAESQASPGSAMSASLQAMVLQSIVETTQGRVEGAIESEMMIFERIEPPGQPPPPDQPEQPQPELAPAPLQEGDVSATIQSLREALKDEDAEVREHALFALTQLNDPQAVESLMMALKDSNPQVREKAAWGLGLRGNQRSVEALVEALRDQDSNVREKAAWSLGLRGDSRAIEPLIQALKDEVADVRAKAAWSLGLKGDSRAVDPLIEALKDGAADVRAMAAWSLGLKGDTRAAEALKAALNDQDKEVRGKARWALGMLLMKFGEEVGGDINLNLENENEITVDRKARVRGRVPGGVAGGVPGGVSGGVPGSVSTGVPGGVGPGVSGGVPGGVGTGVGTGIGSGHGDGVGRGVGGGVSGGVGIGRGGKTVKPDSSGKPKNRLKQM